VTPNPYIERILKARVYDVAIESPLDPAPRLSQRLANKVLLKREDLQQIFSFKLRGAYNRIANLSATAAQRGVICASAGNHAQGVALAAKQRGIPCPALDPVAGTCELHEHRPVACRLHGHLTQIGGRETTPCPLCFTGASDAEIESCRVRIDPAAIDESQFPAGQTIVALALSY